MPPTGSRKDNNPQLKALDKEAKRARGALSCAECRRLKLKCDKTVPCASCKRRGCAAICPNGSLITGQGTRFVLADTEKLHQKISEMSDRIRQLEDALAILQSTLSSEPHPLLSRELIKIKSSIELHAAIDEEAKVQTGGIVRSEMGGRANGGGEEDENEAVIDAFGTLAIRDDGAATFYGRSAGNESLLIGEYPDLFPASSNNPSYSITTSSSSSIPPSQHNIAPSGSPRSAIASLSTSFPFSANTLQQTSTGIDVDYLLVNFLPKWEEAWRLSQLYLEQAPWFYGAVTKRQLLEEMLPMWYFEARGLASGGARGAPNGGSPPVQVPLTPVSPADASGHAQGQARGYSLAGEGQAANAASPESTTSSSSSTTHAGPSSQQPSSAHPTRTAHDLALLFMIFCFGALTDVNLPPAPENTLSEEFFQLTKAALVLEPVLERSPSVATVQTLSLIAIYEGICSRDGSIERTWSVFGISVKLAQSIGLHRDCARWKLSPAETQKRRALFWELFITDCWQSLATGRLATFSLPFVDCELPQDPDSTIAEDGSIQPSFPYWKARFGAECVSAVVQGTLTSRAPRYSIILDLDRKVRDMELPSYAQQALNLDLDSSLGFSDLERAGEGLATGLALGETMSKFMPINYRELTLLYIHRCFFAHAIETHPADPIKSQYAPSFLAGYRSACTILGSVRKQFMLFPRQIARFWVLWTHAFSATVMLSSVATHVSKQSQVAHAAMIELNNACDLFEHAARHGGRAVKFWPILSRLRKKAQKSFDDSARGLPPDIPNDIMKPSKTDEEKNEMEIFGGKTHTVTTRSQNKGNGLRRLASTGSLVSSSRASSGSPKIKPSVQQYLQVPPQIPGPHAQGGIVVDHDMFNGPTSHQVHQQGQQPQQQGQAHPVSSQSSHVQQQLINEYPSFEGVHPSLVHELRGFDGRIEAQVKQASMDTSMLSPQRQEVTEATGYEPYGVNEAVREEEGHRVQMQVQGGMDSVDYHQQQHQHQREMEYQQQQREMEYQQQQQREMEYHQIQQMELERRREEEERKRMELERQGRESERAERTKREYEMHQRAQQLQQQHYQAPPPPQASYSMSPPQQQHPQAQYEGYYNQEQPPPPPLPQARSRHSSLTSRQVYAHGQDTVHHQGQPSPPQGTQYRHQPQPSVHHPQHHQQRSLHVVASQHYANSRETLATPSSVEQTPVTSYNAPAQASYTQAHHYPPQSHQVSSEPQQQQQHQAYASEAHYHYWAAAPTVPDQSYEPQQQQQQEPQYSGQQYQGQVYMQQQPSQQPHNQPFTPGTVLRGIAADDSRLQETWTTYMYNVASPRPFFED